MGRAFHFTGPQLVLAIVLCLGFAFSSQAQQDKKESEKNQIIEYRIELIAENLEAEDLDFTTLFDELSSYYERPLNLNTASPDDLRSLYLLNDFQITSLFDHVQKTGKMASIYELQGIKGFDLETIRLILPFVRVNDGNDLPQLSWKEITKNGTHEVYLRYIRILEEQLGYTPAEEGASENSRYLGDPNRYYARYRFKYGRHISVGVTAEKDAGEEFFAGTQTQGFDYFSAHAYLGDYGRVRHLAIGDYQLQFGQGLTFWSGLAFGKSADLTSIKRNPRTVKPYTSVDENRFLRGAATTISLNDHIDLTAFYSSKKVDANILNATDTSDTDEPVSFSSLQLSGFHHTPGEVADKHSLQERQFGGHLDYNTRTLRLGLTAVRTEYEGDFNRNLSIYNQFDFNSSTNLNTGLDYNWVWRNFNFFGEVSRSENGGWAYQSGALVSLDPRVSLYLLHRNYQRDFQSPTNNAVGESSRNANERGMLIGAVVKPHRLITLTAYFDRFVFPWLRFQTNSPDYGHEVLTQLNYRPSRRLEMYVRYRLEEKGRNSREVVDDIRAVTRQKRQYTRFHLSYQVTGDIRIKSRAEFSNYDQAGSRHEQGYLLYQDFTYRPKGQPYSITVRYSLFDTDSYDSRIYAYENDVLYFFNVPAFTGRGTRMYGVLKYHVKRGFDVWLRYSQTYYSNQDQVGSALNQIEGNTQSEVKAMVRLKF